MDALVLPRNSQDLTVQQAQEDLATKPEVLLRLEKIHGATRTLRYGGLYLFPLLYHKISEYAKIMLDCGAIVNTCVFSKWQPLNVFDTGVFFVGKQFTFEEEGSTTIVFLGSLASPGYETYEVTTPFRIFLPKVHAA